MRAAHLVPVLVSSFLLAGCPGPMPHADAEICEHLKDGPASPVTAVASGEGPAVAADHRRYDVTLAPVSGGNGGTVHFRPAAARDFVIALGADIPLVVTDSAGATIAPERTATSSTACTEIRRRSVFPLAVGTYRLTFGPTPETRVAVVVEAGGH